MEDNLLLIFVRSLELGTVKTRIARIIGDEAALALYDCFVSDTLGLATRAGYPFVVCFHPLEARSTIAGWLGDGVRSVPQEGRDLGERMCRALSDGLSRARRVVLIGSDSPGLPVEVLHEAFACLETSDSVIGPSVDGGYYLIGFSSAASFPAPFENIGWGGADVFRSTTEILRKKQVRVHLLRPWKDLDEYEDLEAFYASHQELPSASPRTIDFLRGLFGGK